MENEESKVNLKQQKFLQSFMSKGILDTKEVKTLLTELNVPTDSAEELLNLVHSTNEAIAPFNLEIRKGIQEDDGANFYCLVNTVETPISRLSSTYTQSELELFKKLIEQIVDSEDGKIGSLAALSLTDKVEKRIGKEEAQEIFDRFERDKWIRKDRDGKISLSVRSLLELDQYLKDVYSEFIKLCNICSKICLLGDTCANCGIKIHLKCAKSLFSRQGEKKTCPAPDCRVVWGQMRTL
ncbi:non-structural maintenance of chromosomes element 1 isoform X2 [Biomphalaria glabrata]|uniref:Non-structural maintenance of chromosomes element 1 homolog n=1 Tax=Biomphalaria glabrata TaxID=6526 RepID=A0A2C9M694_BIOGL|nr:putative non-structural maintenance of chromosomes element 1 isoform X2 [Biomphalaria glabrata]KAI8773810.1 non-structural maintenance of chromosomes element 1 isoform X2 [Biomphalaria glabrata]